MHPTILSRPQLDVLAILKGLPEVGEFYLAGGTALALRHGHRRSIDFDFFRAESFDNAPLLAALDDAFGEVERLSSAKHTLYIRLRGVTTSFFRLPYPLLEPVEPTPWSFGLASDRDIAAMKLEAVAGRGSRKDFVDLRVLCRSLTMEQVFECFDQKYGHKRTDPYHRVRALAYFEDAEAEPMPEMLEPFDWEATKVFFEAEARRLIAEGIHRPSPGRK